MFVHKKISIISILSLTGSNSNWKEIISVEIFDKIVLRKPDVWDECCGVALSLCRMLSVVHWCCAVLTPGALKDDIFPWIESSSDRPSLCPSVSLLKQKPSIKNCKFLGLQLKLIFQIFYPTILIVLKIAQPFFNYKIYYYNLFYQ